MQIDSAKIKEPPISMRKTERNLNSRSGLYGDEITGEFYKFSLDKLIPFKMQARIDFDDEGIKCLAETIIEHGIRQPLTVVPSPGNEGKYEIVSGERRFRAAKIANLDRVPCIIIHDYHKAEEIALIENLQRQDLHPIELGEAFKNILSNKICNSMDDIAKKLSLAKSKVVESISYTKLPEMIKNKLISLKLTQRSLLRDLSGLGSEEEMLNRIKLDVDQIQNKVERKKYIRKSIDSLIMLTKNDKNIIFRKDVFYRIDQKKQKEIITDIEKIISDLRTEIYSI